ncbi:MAG: 50S ribosomal protein L17 [Bacteroidota bacterium]
MRHRKKVNHLGRKAQHRNAMLSNMAASLILHKRIYTTLAKAKALKVYVEPLITKSKEDSTHSRRTVFSYLQNKHAVSELFREVSQKIADRPGGYTRILKTGFRQGDAAEMCFIELVDYNLNMLKTAEDTAKKTRRSRRGKKSSGTEEKTTQAQKKTDKPAADEPAAEKEKQAQPVAETKPETEPEAKKDDTADVADETKEKRQAEEEAKEDDNKKQE